MQVTLHSLGALFTAGVIVHNTEEGFLLPAWSLHAGKWHAPVRAKEFRFAVTVLSALLIVIAVLASVSERGSFGAYLMAGYVLAMVLNVFMPHVLASVFTRKYMPGTATAVLFNLPLGLLYLRQALLEHNIEADRFYWAGPLVILAILVSVPALFAIGRKLFAPR